MTLASIPLTTNERKFLVSIASKIEDMNQKTMTVGKAAKIVEEEIQDSGFCDYQKSILLQLPSWFRNCGCDYFEIEGVCNIIRTWSPAIEL